ncbi:disease resistance protein Roq1-like [Rhodamnia argentea]|uniref:Disease resistance protein Roq1-like n=1 Tax=Rhodamnia argentea TaxID=178133 RepID=A0ABM3H7V4_9MYRT|nr:disease resistance protein Roq1-like [Rhodamnia argentea]
MNAIEESLFAIIIFSENYASSPWCLEEVVKIMECKERKGLVVLPVFYKVEPREVRGGRDSYRRDMAEHEFKFGKDSEIMKRWKKALFDAGSLSGWDLNDGYILLDFVRDEAILIKKIVEEISMQPDRRPLHVAKHPVGIHRQVEKLESMLNLESDDVFMIGLWGQGGIGKTTLAKALYNGIFRQFEGSCFLVNVREASKDSKDLVPLQEKLLAEILLGKTSVVYSVDGGINLMQDRLCRKKVLLVLDDVNDVKQLNALAGECEWFGKGSMVIITTRDSHLLTSHGIEEDHIYEAKGLEYFEAFELFNKHAFPRNNKAVIRRDLVNSALHYANGLPLALEVLGSFLCGRTEREWESALNKLVKSPEKTINDVLKLSYDGLEDYEKDVFLDICCFFKGRSTKYIIKVLNSCDFDTIIGVQVLVEKSLIIEEEGALQMHDLIQLMGMDIVKQECRDDPGRRSRLWLCDDVRDVLSGDMGTNAVKAIVLNLHKPEEIYIGHDAFTNMRRLRMLIMINVHNPFQGPICLPNELRWFEWPECPPWIPEFSSGPKKLVGLDMHKSNIRVLREQFKDFKNLKFINFSECQSVVYMPDLYCTPNLEELDLHGCKNLKRAHDSVAYHDKLQFLNLSGCSKLHHFSDVLQSKNLQHLNLNHCSKLQTFPDIPETMKGLQRLRLRGTSIEELPVSIANLVSLEDMILSECKKLAILPSSIYRLQNLENLSLDGCSKLIKFPKEEEDSSDPQTKTGFPKLKILDLSRCNLSEVEFLENRSCFPTLTTMMLSGNNFTNLPACEQLHNLLSLQVSCCRQLQEIINIPGKLWFAPEERCQRSFVLVEDGTVSFMASQDLYDKFLGLIVCVVFSVEDGEKEVCFDIMPHVNGQRQNVLAGTLDLFYSDHVWIQYLATMCCGECCKEQLISVNSRRTKYFRVSSGTMKKLGYMLKSWRLTDDLKAGLEENQLVDPNSLREASHSEDSDSEELERRVEFQHEALDQLDHDLIDKSHIVY